MAQFMDDNERKEESGEQSPSLEIFPVKTRLVRSRIYFKMNARSGKPTLLTPAAVRHWWKFDGRATPQQGIKRNCPDPQMTFSG